MRVAAGFVLSFFTGRLVVNDSPAGRFLDLDDVEMDVESVLDSVEGSGFFTLCRFGVGGGAWFESGSSPVEHVSYFQTGKEHNMPPYL